MRRWVAIAAGLVALSGCGTPQERCIASATREIATLDRLIAESRADIARGYSYEEHIVTRWQWVRCDGLFDAPGTTVPGRCWEPYNLAQRKPVAIDPEAESRKLDALLQRRAALAPAAENRISECRVAHPAG
ncbi:MAG: hypothetical protein KDE03_13970 [Rhodobacteraceae bacterium]|nr:hypothetical protein [Paracoccaceae bacterium]